DWRSLFESRQLAPFVAFRLLIGSRFFQRNDEYYIATYTFCKGYLKDHLKLHYYEPKLTHDDP
ncbi:MAG: hypothetical protein AAF126_04475, partial [Chloroflexota bacterium]